MDVNAMGRRCPRSKALGLARLERHRLAVMREGWLTAVRAPSSAVHGVLWDLAMSDIAALDRYEGVSQGFYVKLTQAVIAERGPKQAIVYFGVNAGPGAARPAYIAEVIAAARSWPLPGEGVAALEETGEANLTIGTGRQRDVPNFGSGRIAANAQVRCKVRCR
jgi:hypothetical protein